jgi:hypothetical protein
MIFSQFSGILLSKATGIDQSLGQYILLKLLELQKILMCSSAAKERCTGLFCLPLGPLP